jgi:chromosome segregation ATPase
VLYLGEVQKQKGVVFGNAKTDIKLLACQRNDQSWTAVPGEELVTIPPAEANSLNDGQMVLAEVVNKMVQRILPDSAKVLVTRLENFSRQLEKAKKQAEETEALNESLQIQFQEMSTRQMELAMAKEEMSSMEEDFLRLQQQRHEVETLRKSADHKRQETERLRQELAAAQEHLEAEKSRLESLRADVSKGALTPEQAQSLQGLIGRLSMVVPSTDNLHQNLDAVENLLNMLIQFENTRNTAVEKTKEVKNYHQQLQQLMVDFQQLQTSLIEAKAELKVQQTIYHQKQDLLHSFNHEQDQLQGLYTQVKNLADGSLGVDMEELEKMPLGELEEVVVNLQQELKKMAEFVNSQEEELMENRQRIKDLQDKVKTAGEYERISLETELEDEKQAYSMLNLPLIEQRNKVREKELNVNLHFRVLRQRQGLIDSESGEADIDLKPLLNSLDIQRQQNADKVQKLEQEINQIQSMINTLEQTVNNGNHSQDLKQQEINNLSHTLQQNQQGEAELWVNVNLLEQQLQHPQEALNNILQQLKSLNHTITEIKDTQMNAIQQVEAIVNSLTHS